MIKSTKLLLLIITVLFSAFSHAGSEFYVNPNPGEAGSHFYFYFTNNDISLDKYLPKIRIYDGAAIVSENFMQKSTPNKYSYNSRISKAGKRKYTMGLSTNGSYKWTDFKYYDVTVPIILKVSSVTTNPRSVESGKSITFIASLSNNLPSGYKAQVEFGAGQYLDMKCIGINCSFPYKVNQVGANRNFTVRIINNRGVSQNSKNGTYTVTKPPETQYSPTVSVISASTRVEEGTQYKVTLKLEDQNSNLQNFRIDWGDGTADTWVNISGGSITKTVSHTYTTAKTYYWDALVSDYTSKKNKTAAQKIIVTSKVPTINSVTTNPRGVESGKSITFIASLSKNLPSGYKAQIEFGASKYLDMACIDKNCSFSHVVRTIGVDRRFTVRIVNSNNVNQNSKNGVFTVTEPPEIQYAPILTISSAGKTTTVGLKYCISLKATDQNNNLKQLNVNWGDDPNHIPDVYSYAANTGSHTEQMCHIYHQPGSFTWGATVKDHTGREDKVILPISVNVGDQSPIILVQTNPIVSGNQLTATINISDDKDVTRTSFTIFQKGDASTAMDISSSVFVVSPKSSYSPIPRSWGFNPSLENTTTAWNINISGLPVGSYEIEFHATDGVNQSVDSGKYAFIKVVTDQRPIVTINTKGSGDNNPKIANFEINITAVDDIGLKEMAYVVYNTSSGTPTDQKGIIPLSGVNDTKVFTVDLKNLEASESYEVRIRATDTKPQISEEKSYFFQKQTPIVLPTIEKLLPINIADTDQEKFTFRAQLSGSLPTGYGIFLNFDNLDGLWFLDSNDGGHIQLTHQENNLCSLDTSLNKLGIRFFRAGIFKLNDEGDISDDVLASDWSNTQTCSLYACLMTIQRPYNYGNPAMTGGGSELFKNIDVVKKNYHLSIVDMTATTKGPSFSFSRAYNSMHEKPWTFAYEMKVHRIDSKKERQVAIGPREDGHIQYFFKDMDDQWHAINPGDFDQLIETVVG